jgi:L-ascorbate metabolism protein UlaG (beta-lactamase superfamily)
LIDARAKIFGIENVDARTGALPKDKVIFSWLGHNTGAVSLRGRVIMLDTYIARLEVTPGRTPIVIKDLVDMKPEALFIGHGHGDHADNAAFLAAKTGATI